MNVWTVIALLSLANPTTVEEGGVRIETSVNSHVYSWTITNIDASPITRFEINAHNTYNHQIAPGWEMEYEDGRFRTWTADPSRSIRPGGSKTFTARVSSSGAILGLVTAHVSFDVDQPEITFAEIWGPTPMPTSIIPLIAGTVAGIALLHSGLLVRQRRRCVSEP